MEDDLTDCQLCGHPMKEYRRHYHTDCEGDLRITRMIAVAHYEEDPRLEVALKFARLEDDLAWLMNQPVKHVKAVRGQAGADLLIDMCVRIKGFA